MVVVAKGFSRGKPGTAPGTPEPEKRSFEHIEPAEIPDETRGRARSSKYRATIEEFVDSGLRTAKVKVDDGTLPITVYHQLRKQTFDDPVRVIKRGDDVFLMHDVTATKKKG